MGVSNFAELKRHAYHRVIVGEYGNYNIEPPLIYNVAVECLDCNEVLFDFDNEEINK